MNDRERWTVWAQRLVTSLPKPAKRGPKPRKRVPRVHVGGKRSRLPAQLAEYRAWEKEADRIWSLVVRATSSRCFRCRRRRTAHADHLVSRNYRATRWVIDNGCPLCAGCHRLVTSDTAEHVALAIRRVGSERWEQLNVLKYAGKVDPRTAVVMLTTEAARRKVRIA